MLYSKYFFNKIIASAGVDVGYEKYSGNILYPFEEYGFIRPSEEKLREHYEFNRTIPYAQLNLNIGYKFDLKFAPEIQFGWMSQVPRNAKRFRYDMEETTIDGFSNYSYSSNGSWGAAVEKSFILDHIGYIYVGCQLPLKTTDRISVGLQLQSKVINTYSFSSFRNAFYDNWSSTKSVEEFNGRHKAINFIISYKL